jgi:hypothetical protein
LLRWGLTNLLPSNPNPPDFHLPGSWDSRHETLHPANLSFSYMWYELKTNYAW